MGVMDKDARAGIVDYEVKFGDMMTSAGTIVSNVNMYKVTLVDSYGRDKNINVGTFSAPSTPPSCCTSDAYTFKLKGNISATQLRLTSGSTRSGYSTTKVTAATLGDFRLAITPYSGTVSLPSIYISDTLSDSKKASTSFSSKMFFHAFAALFAAGIHLMF